MASTSASSIQKNFKYDVFISFRGEDTRKNFVDHLYHALQQKNIVTYKDDKEIKKGKRISDELFKSIEESKFYIIVFSKNYAFSSWCLDELVKIMECQKTNEHIAYPVFYDVEPSEVRKQNGVVGEAFGKYKEEDVEKWREALRGAANLAGWELKNTLDGHEAEFIQKIVEEVSLDLRFINLSIDEKLVGMKKRVNDVVSSLELDIDDVRIIGIKGIGGGGKTTLARAVFDQISFRFEGSSFVENVREISKNPMCGLKSLQKQVLSDVLNKQDIMVNGVYEGKKMMKLRMCVRKVIVVLDDVDHIDQLEALAGEPSWFKTGSRIIITTREEQVLVAHRVPKNLILDVNLLSHKEATCLFNKFAFGREIANQGYEILSDQVVRYAAGLPLTIRVLGSFLCGKDELEWTDALERLKTIPLKETLEILEISYNSLEEDYKEIFLDVACMLKGWDKELAIIALECCGFHAINGLRVLEQKSLITVSRTGRLDMHDHIEEMGQNIIRRSQPNQPHKHSRLWIQDEISDILIKSKGTKAIRCMKVQNANPVTVMKGLRTMKELRFLDVIIHEKEVGYFDDYDLNYINIDADSLYLSEGLQYLQWDGYPFRCLPANFQANNLVGLKMHLSNIDQLWEGKKEKVLKKLRFIILSFCKLRFLDIGLIPNLERLTIVACINLVEICMPAENFKLKSLTLRSSKMRTLNIGRAYHLEQLIIKDNVNLVELHFPTEKLKRLHLRCCKIKTLNLMRTLNLQRLDLEQCEELVELHMPIESPKLKTINIRYSKLRTLNLAMSKNLERLDLEQCEDLVELHMPIESPKLKTINIHCSKLRTIYLGLSPCLKSLDLHDCLNLVEIHAPVGCLSGFVTFKPVLVHQDFLMVGCSGELLLIARSFGICPLHPENNLPKFHFEYTYKDLLPSSTFHFECTYNYLLPSSTGNLMKLLSFSPCACKNLVNLSQSICGLQYLRKLTLEGSIPEVPKELDKLGYLQELTLLSTNIEYLPDNICLSRHLKILELKSCCFLKQLPEDIGRLEYLEELRLRDCTSLQDIPNSICEMKCLKCFHLTNCILVKKLPKEMGRLKCLKELNIEGTGILDLPQSIYQLEDLIFFL